MKCWICGNDGDSGEHSIKATDIKLCFPNVSQKQPIYRHSELKRNEKIGSIKSKKLHMGAKICSHCNNVRTASYDRAWEKLSKYIHENWKIIKETKRINLQRVFPGGVNRNSLNVHLFFVKLFGCRIKEHKLPIDIKLFSSAIMNNRYHPDLFLIMGETPAELNSKYVGLTPVYSLDIKGRSGGAVWMYTVNNLTVKLMYSPLTHVGSALGNSWNPKKRTKILRLGKI